MLEGLSDNKNGLVHDGRPPIPVQVSHASTEGVQDRNQPPAYLLFFVDGDLLISANFSTASCGNNFK